jgi:eukaryotic-like serine/threonine-protein kinase
MTTTAWDLTPSPSPVGPASSGGELLARYRALARGERLGWATRYHKLRLLGRGGQGVVHLARREGADGFTLPVALKTFSPEPYRDDDAYREDMARVARVAARVARLQHDHLLQVHDFSDQGGVRVMEMEWLDGYDLRALLSRRMLARSRARLTPERWDYLGRVVLTDGPAQPRLKPGVAIQVLRDCLAGLAALHRDGVVHGDLKPANVMVKRTGSAKLIDIGSAADPGNPAARRLWSPAYAAPEVLRGGDNTPVSDLASLGYVLVEMLAGRFPFEGLQTRGELLEAKEGLDRRLPELLPAEVSCNELLLSLCRGLMAADPVARIQSAEAADLGRRGAADFHRQLVKTDLASEYENDLRAWLEGLGPVPETAG